MNCKAILFFFFPLFAKGNLKASLILFVGCSFLNITDLSMRLCLSSGERSSKIWSRRWFHRKWHMSRVGANDSLNKYKNLLPLAIIDQEHRGSGFSLLQCQYEFEVGSAHPWKKGAQNIISCIKIRYFRDTRREAWNIFPYFMVYFQPVNAFWTLTAIVASIQARSLFSGVFAHQSHICPLHYVGIC